MSELATSGQLRWAFARIAVITIPLTLLLGRLSAQLSGSVEENLWFSALDKPGLYPPGWAFGVVWTLLYVMMGAALAYVIHARGAYRRTLALVLFAVQLLLNLAWSPLFFGAHQIGLSFFLILAIIAAALPTAWWFGQIRKVAGWLMVPYLLWLGFAAVLCWQIWQLNPDSAAVQSGTVDAVLSMPTQQE